MNTNYINKYIKYKDKYIKYIKYINQNGGACSHLIIEKDIGEINDNKTEESYKDTEFTCRDIYSLVNDISLCLTPSNIKNKFPRLPISSKLPMTIHDIWNIIILNNNITKKLNIISTSFNLIYLYNITNIQFDFIIKCLQILSYNDIYAFKDCTYNNIPNRTLYKLKIEIVSSFLNKRIISNSEKSEITLDIESLMIIRILLATIYIILSEKIEYIKNIPIDDKIDNTTVFFGRKIKNDNNFHFNNENLILYICDKINTEMSYWPQNSISIYDELSLHIIWTHIIKYNILSNIFIYSQLEYNFIEYCLNNTLDKKITKLKCK